MKEKNIQTKKKREHNKKENCTGDRGEGDYLAENLIKEHARVFT